jgi:hypothetical protein
MAKRRQISTAKREREAARLAAYQAKASDVQPFITGRLRAGRRMTAADKATITRLHRQIFGSAPGEPKAPSLLPRDPAQRDTVAPIIIRDKRKLAKSKRDLGQPTSPRIKVVFVRRKPLPGQSGQSLPPTIVHRVSAPDFVVDGFLISVIEPIDPVAYATNPRREEARAMAALWVAFGEIQAAMSTDEHNWIIHPDDAVFAPQCNGHDALVVGGSQEDVAEELQIWRNRYNQRANEADHVAGWLTGIKMIIRLGAAGREQYANAVAVYRARKAARLEWRKRLAQYREDNKPSQPNRRKPGRRRKRRT